MDVMVSMTSDFGAVIPVGVASGGRQVLTAGSDIHALRVRTVFA